MPRNHRTLAKLVLAMTVIAGFAGSEEVRTVGELTPLDRQAAPVDRKPGTLSPETIEALRKSGVLKSPSPNPSLMEKGRSVQVLAAQSMPVSLAGSVWVLGNAKSSEALAGALSKMGATDEAAAVLAKQAYDLAKSSGGKAVTLSVMAGGAAYFAVETFQPDMSAAMKYAWIGGSIAAALLAFFLLRRAGVLK